MRCIKCYGTGQVLGNGMMLTDCSNCDGIGTLSETKSDAKTSVAITSATSTTLDKRGKPYREAIKKMISANPKMSRDEAVKLFETAYAKS